MVKLIKKLCIFSVICIVNINTINIKINVVRFSKDRELDVAKVKAYFQKDDSVDSEIVSIDSSTLKVKLITKEQLMTLLSEISQNIEMPLRLNILPLCFKSEDQLDNANFFFLLALLIKLSEFRDASVLEDWISRESRSAANQEWIKSSMFLGNIELDRKVNIPESPGLLRIQPEEWINVPFFINYIFTVVLASISVFFMYYMLIAPLWLICGYFLLQKLWIGVDYITSYKDIMSFIFLFISGLSFSHPIFIVSAIILSAAVYKEVNSQDIILLACLFISSFILRYNIFLSFLIMFLYCIYKEWRKSRNKKEFIDKMIEELNLLLYQDALEEDIKNKK